MDAIKIITKVNEKLDKLKAELDNEEKYKVQGQMLRSRVRWTELSERNTKYFYGLEKSKSKAKNMNALDVNGATVKDPKIILEKQRDFYKKLYTADPNVNFNWVEQNTKKLSDTERVLLDSPITVNEIAAAIKEMPPGKAGGLDGLSAEFYKMFFIHVKDLLLDVFVDSKKCGRLPLTLRRGVLTLIPKRDKCRKVLKNWRPISLLNLDYKVLSKIIANRFKLIATSIISPEQAGFMKGRSTTENIRRLLDVMDFALRHNLPALIVQVDLEKAFDRVSYESMYKIFKFFHFGDEFINWIRPIVY